MSLGLHRHGHVSRSASYACLTEAKTSPPPKYLHGMWSFALEQEGQYKEWASPDSTFRNLAASLCQEAERIAWEGFSFEKELGPDAWLDHSLAHSLYFQGHKRAAVWERITRLVCLFLYSCNVRVRACACACACAFVCMFCLFRCFSQTSPACRVRVPKNVCKYVHMYVWTNVRMNDCTYVCPSVPPSLLSVCAYAWMDGCI